MPSNGLSLINTDGLSDVAVKLLDMIEKSVGWTVSPKGSQRDFEDAVEYYKKQLMDDTSIPVLVKSAKIASARKELRQYINQGQIIAEALPHIQSNSDLHNLSPDWLTYFFEYAKNINEESIQRIWARLLAEECNGTTSIQRNLIHILSLMDSATAKAFALMCRLVVKIPIIKAQYAIESRYTPKYIPIVTSFMTYSLYFVLPEESREKKAMLEYKSSLPEPEQLAIMKELGLIIIRENIDSEFSYPYNFGLTHHKFEKVSPESTEERLVKSWRTDYIIQYFDKEYVVEPDKNVITIDPEKIRLGLVQLTSIGEMLYKSIEREPLEDFEFFLEKYLGIQNFLIRRI